MARGPGVYPPDRPAYEPRLTEVGADIRPEYDGRMTNVRDIGSALSVRVDAPAFTRGRALTYEGVQRDRWGGSGPLPPDREDE